MRNGKQNVDMNRASLSQSAFPRYVQMKRGSLFDVCNEHSVDVLVRLRLWEEMHAIDCACTTRESESDGAGIIEVSQQGSNVDALSTIIEALSMIANNIMLRKIGT